MPLNVNSVGITDVKANGVAMNEVIVNGVTVWTRAVDTAITLSPSSKSASDPCYAYDIDATIYSNIDLSLYKGIKFYVNSAGISASHAGGSNSITVVANNGTNDVGSVTLATAYTDYQGTKTDTSNAGKTLTLNFTSATGKATLKVVGSGTCPSDGASWSLSNAVLLAR